VAERRKYSKKYCKYCEQKVDFLDYKQPANFKFSLSERYKIMPRRLTGNCKKHQVMVEQAIKRARAAAIIPYVADRKKVIENPFADFK
jgi:small subunit ribosomal protein S18